MLPRADLNLPTPQQNTVSGLPAGARPHGIAYFGSDSALISDLANARVFVTRISTNSLLATISTGTNYSGNGTIAVAPNLNFALASGSNTNTGTDNLAVISAPFNASSVINVVPLPGFVGSYQTQAISFNAAGRAFVYHSTGISVLDPPYNSIAFTIPVSDNDFSGGLAISPDGNKLLVTNFDNIVRIFTAPFSATSTPATITISGANGLDGIQVAPDGTKALVVDAFTPLVFAINAPFTGSSTVEQIPLPPAFATGFGFEDVGISADSQFAILTGNSAGDAGPAAFIRGPFTAAEARSFAVNLTGGRGDGAVRFLPPGLAPGLTVSKTATASVASGANLTYTLNYGNTGTAGATNVVVRDTLPAGTTFVSASNGGTVSGGVVTWNVGNVAAGTTNQTLTLVVNVTAAQGATVSNNNYSIQADSVAAIPGPPVTTNVTAPVTPNLSISKTAPTSVVSGANLSYTITYGNAAGAGNATNVVVRDTLPAGTTFVSASSGGTLSGGVVTWNIGSLAAGTTNQTLTLVVRVTAAAGATITNSTYSIQADSVTAIAGAAVTTSVTAPVSNDLAVSLTDSPDPANLSDSITYLATVTTNATANSVVLTDDLIANVNFISATPSQGTCSRSSNRVTCSLGTLNAGATATVAVVVTAVRAEILSHRVDVTSSLTEANRINNTANEVTTINGAAGAIRNLRGFTANFLERNDDDSTSAVPLGFTVNFFGTNYTTAFVNNNGNITFDAALSTFTPFDLTTTQRVIIAPFFADVDTFSTGSSVVTYGTDTVNGRPAFGVNYINVGYFSNGINRLNSFQVVLIDRSDIGPGSFDIELNYNKIQWETGNASGGTGGLGGSSARVGYSNGTRQPNTFFELSGSAVNGALLDSNPTTGLINRSLNNPQLGRYFFQVRNGLVMTFSLSGRVTDASNVGLGSVTLTLSGTQSGTATTDANGNYAFTGLPMGGTYTVTPARSGFVFTPPNRTFTNLSSNQTANFTGTGLSATTPVGDNVMVSVGGVVLIFDRVTTAGVTTATPITPASAGTLPAGYSLTSDSTAADITTTAVFTGNVTVCLFAPSAANLLTFSKLRLLHGEGGSLVDRTILPPDAPSPSFATRRVCARVTSLSPFVLAAVATPSIVGRITDASNAGLSNATVTLTSSGPTVVTTTDSDGNFILPNLAMGLTYTVTPAKTGFAFTPPNRQFTNLTTDQTANFTAAPATFTISGFVRDASNNGVPNVAVTLTGVGGVTSAPLTGADGGYSFAGLASGNYTITAARVGFDFTPPLISLVNLGGNSPNNNFLATPTPNPTPTPTPDDNFGGAVRDPNRWNLGLVSQPATNFDAQVAVTQGPAPTPSPGATPDPTLAGRLRIQPRSNAEGPSFNGYVSARPLNLNLQNVVSVRAERPATGTMAATIFSVGRDNNNFFRFVVTSAPLTQLGPEFESLQAPARPAEAGMMIVFQSKANGVTTTEMLPYNALQQQFWRVRRDAVNNIIFLETSPNGVDSWTIRLQRPVVGMDVNSLVAELIAGTFDGTINPTIALFDDYTVAPPAGINFTPNAYSAGENDGTVTITVDRVGNTESPASVQYATSDGTAVAGQDYTATSGTLTFAAGQTRRTFTVNLIDDLMPEPQETFNISLNNALGGLLGVNLQATVNIIDNDTGVNRIDTTVFFVTQQYRDFLARDPDTAGLNFWVGQITSCGNNQSCISRRRIEVSAAFFTSPEFFDTGGFVYRFYRASFTRTPQPLTFAEFNADRLTIIGGTNLEAQRQAFANQWVLRTEFRQRYDPLNSVAYVDTLFANTGVTPTLEEREFLVTSLINRSRTRAEVLRRVTDLAAADLGFRQREKYRLFVLSQYFGYLRRDPDQAGFDFWLNQLNTTGNIPGMVCAFVTSAEYQLRFDPFVTRNNNECAALAAPATANQKRRGSP